MKLYEAYIQGMKIPEETEIKIEKE